MYSFLIMARLRPVQHVFLFRFGIIAPHILNGEAFIVLTFSSPRYKKIVRFALKTKKKRGNFGDVKLRLRGLVNEEAAQGGAISSLQEFCVKKKSVPKHKILPRIKKNRHIGVQVIARHGLIGKNEGENEVYLPI